MTRTSSAAALLHVAAQDLHAGKQMLRDRLPALARAVTDGDLAQLLDAEVDRAEQQAGRLADTGLDTAGPVNLWMSGILDDADRDAESHQPGPLLDIALVGALRKAKTAEIVSADTAAALAQWTGQEVIGAAAAANRQEDRACDRALAVILATLTGNADAGSAVLTP